MDILKSLEEALKQTPHEMEQRELILETVEQAAEQLAAPLGLAADEVAIQLIVGEGNSLRFLYPRVLLDSGATFPISSTSIAGRSVMLRRATFDNEVNSTRHLLFFERLNTGVRPPLPIHKMATIPLLVGENIIGIVQLSRRSETLEQAGADFTDQDVLVCHKALQLVGQLVSQYVLGRIM